MESEDISFYLFQLIQLVLYAAVLFSLIFYLRSPSKVYDYIEAGISLFTEFLSKVTYVLYGQFNDDKSNTPQESFNRSCSSNRDNVISTILVHIICPFGIIRGIVILVVARILLNTAQPYIYFAKSRFEVFLFLAGFMDISLRTTGLITELLAHKNKGKDASLGLIINTVVAKFLSSCGGQFLAPLWVCSIFVYLFV